jgi:phosphoglycolate phosphatase
MLQIAFDMTPEHPEFIVMRDEFFDNYQNALAVKSKLFEGVEDVIGHIEASALSWGVVTNKSSRFTDPMTQAMPLFKSAGAIISGDTTPHAKPHPEPMFEAARRLGLPPEVCLYVGDDERDIVAGKAAGMGTVAATYGYLGSASDVGAWQADAQINSPAELLQLLSQA